jgi:hypothetical protein
LATAREKSELIKPDSRSQDVPRTPREVNVIFHELLHRRGLLYVADLVSGRRPSTSDKGRDGP